MTARQAQWQYVSFKVWRLSSGQVVLDKTGVEEIGLVILSGRGTIESSNGTWNDIGGRESVFDGSPFVLYLPPGIDYRLVAHTDCEVARCASLAQSGAEPYVVKPDEIVIETRGQGNAARHIRHLLEADRPAERLFLVECITPGGNWSSYPPHKHDTEAYPQETYLEETYYHRFNPSQGFGFQRIYGPKVGADQGIVIRDGSLVAVRSGYHPVAAAPGYDLYYLNVMAGPIREWRFTDDPDHSWISERWKRYG